jgi:hypothetical protein
MRVVYGPRARSVFLLGPMWESPLCPHLPCAKGYTYCDVIDTTRCLRAALWTVSASHDLLFSRQHADLSHRLLALKGQKRTLGAQD